MVAGTHAIPAFAGEHDGTILDIVNKTCDARAAADPEMRLMIVRDAIKPDEVGGMRKSVSFPTTGRGTDAPWFWQFLKARRSEVLAFEYARPHV